MNADIYLDIFTAAKIHRVEKTLFPVWGEFTIFIKEIKTPSKAARQTAIKSIANEFQDLDEAMNELIQYGKKIENHPEILDDVLNSISL